MTINIAYLYYDLLNLYGESGNIKVLKKQLENQGILVNVKFLSLGDDLDFSSYDLVYMGMGTEENQRLVINHLKKYKNDIKKYYENDKFFLITGNSIELFGKYISLENNKKIKCLGLFNYTAKREPFRMVDEVLFKCPLSDSYILGFQNQGSTIKDNKDYLFDVVKGIGSYPNSKNEGIVSRNFYGSYVIGPLLARNPMFVKFFIKKLVLSIDKDFKFKKFDLTVDFNAYNTFIKNYYKDIITNS